MNFVPKNWYANSEHKRRLLEEVPAFIGNFIPVPTRLCPQGDRFGLSEVRDKIASEPQLVRTLERSRFRTSFSEEARLPLGSAVRLEDFEAELRALGLIAVDEIVVQSLSRPDKFRVQKRNVVDDLHPVVPSSKEASCDSGTSPSLLEVPKPLSSALGPVKGEERSVPLQGLERMAHAIASQMCSDLPGAKRLLD